MKQLFIYSIFLFQYFGVNAQATNGIIITEIFADPTPSHGLPDKEFIEIYNNTGKEINLEGYQLFYNSSNVSFPEFVISSGEYVIVCRENNVSLFQPYGKTIGLSKFSLLNSGTALSLVDATGILVYEVNYSPEWYADGKEQGYSLEMIDINYPCREKANWTSSFAVIGGTPGKSNASSSNLPDLTPPSLISYNEVGPKIFQFVFSEKLDNSEESLSVEATDLAIKRIYFSANDKSSIFLELEKGMEEDTSYDLIFNTVSDCSKNVAEPIKVSIGNIAYPALGDLWLSEILFNPKSGGKDFVEIYNHSGKLLNLKGLGLSRLGSTGDLEEVDVLFDKSQTIKPNQFLCFTTDKTSLIKIYPNAVSENIIEVNRLPAFNNDKGHVFLLSANQEILDSFEYDEKMHHSSLDIRDGISLERASYQKITSLWLSASSSENYATPGYEISNDTQRTNFKVIVQNDLNLSSLLGHKDEIIVNYSSIESGSLSSKIYDINGKLITSLASNQYMKNAVKISWKGYNGTMEYLPSGYYILYSELRTSDHLYENKQKFLLVQR